MALHHKEEESQRCAGLWLYKNKAIFMIAPLNLKAIIFQKLTKVYKNIPQIIFFQPKRLVIF